MWGLNYCSKKFWCKLCKRLEPKGYAQDENYIINDEK
jgi:hypothetical protein